MNKPTDPPFNRASELLASYPTEWIQSIKIFITDFGLATEVNATVNYPVGTPEFLDPIYLLAIAGKKTTQVNSTWDLYAMGRSLTHLFKDVESTPTFIKELIAEMTYFGTSNKGINVWFNGYGVSLKNGFEEYKTSQGGSRMSLTDIKAKFDTAYPECSKNQENSV